MTENGSRHGHDQVIAGTIVLDTSVYLYALAEARQSTKVATIGWLEISDLGTGRELFGRRLRELGYLEGKKITIEDRSANNKIDRLPALVDDLVRLKVDVLCPRRALP